MGSVLAVNILEMPSRDPCIFRVRPDVASGHEFADRVHSIAISRANCGFSFYKIYN